MKPKKKKNEEAMEEEDLMDWRRFFSGMVAGILTTLLLLAFVVFARRIFQLGGIASFALMQRLQRIQGILVDTTIRWGKEFQSKVACIFEELYA